MNQLILSRYAHNNFVWALGVEGDEEYQRLTENLLVNYGVIGPSAIFHRWSDTFGYFVVDVRKLESGLTEYFQNMYFCNKQCAAGFRRIWGIRDARKFMTEIKREDFMLNKTKLELEETTSWEQ